ncbi:aliphatic sulfonate ABC transporter permease SsuC [Paenibacillus agilis]|uniref:Aliphatic sulfonate ABC transporter permease SsuC n=1 Tax=Paenibacillus agilis TaxID=3020863 RepID=A0A559IPQ3_9BACL|nr:aliphatic sulfonate ABC transporter permease SsuC [Paenibacillus agilis]TVX89608.1 aliphatic sulfonate ABC transporter permease SsuC [Paenibacillus agilis]
MQRARLDSTLKRWQNRSWIAWVVPITLLLLWQVLGQLGVISTRILPTPIAVIEALITLISNGMLFDYIGTSTGRALIGSAIGGSIGFSLGLLNGVVPLAEKLTDTSIQMVRNIPHLALIPLVILWFGIDEAAKLFLVALGVAFPIYLNTFHGIRSVDPSLIEMGKVYGLRGWALFRNIILPGALPSILVGVRFALGTMWITLIVAETISADSGIGYMAMNAREFMQMDVVVLSILLYALLGKLSDSIAKWCERLFLQWHPNYGKGQQAGKKGVTSL